MNISLVFLFLLVLVCPLSMTLMMRRGHKHSGHQNHGDTHADMTERDKRIAQLEREVRGLREER